jgi:hypothetical protein
MNTNKIPSHYLITIPDIMEEKHKICDIRYKDLCLPPGLLLELEPHSSTQHYAEETDGFTVVTDELFDNLLKNEKRRRVQKKTRKIRPTKVLLTLKNKL